jgi:hypothetical protein
MNASESKQEEQCSRTRWEELSRKWRHVGDGAWDILGVEQSSSLERGGCSELLEAREWALDGPKAEY